MRVYAFFQLWGKHFSGFRWFSTLKSFLVSATWPCLTNHSVHSLHGKCSFRIFGSLVSILSTILGSRTTYIYSISNAHPVSPLKMKNFLPLLVSFDLSPSF